LATESSGFGGTPTSVTFLVGGTTLSLAASNPRIAADATTHASYGVTLNTAPLLEAPPVVAVP
jgi:hypothetical protein